MEKVTLEEFKNESNEEIVKSIMNMNNGYVTSKDLTKFGIHRMYLNILWKKGVIEKVGNGIYIDSNKIEDSYYVLCLSMPNMVFSHMTALYFLGLSIKAPDGKYDITVKKTYNCSHLKDYNVFYVKNELFKLGLTCVETPMGNKVRCYDMERCMCDIIRSKNRMDSELVKHSIRAYLKRKDKDLVKLSNYAKKMGIQDEVMNYMEFFLE